MSIVTAALSAPRAAVDVESGRGSETLTALIELTTGLPIVMLPVTVAICESPTEPVTVTVFGTVTEPVIVGVPVIPTDPVIEPVLNN